MITINKEQFSSLRNFLWPIHKHELKKFLPMAFMMFCALFNYTIVRDLKDTLVVKAVGAEAISFIKFWVVLPSAMYFVLMYSKASNRLSKDQLFYYTLIPFIIFFTVFGFVLYPIKEYLLPNEKTIDSLIELMPAMRWFIVLYAKWIYVLFYTFAELWGSVVIGLLFWQFANQTTQVFEAKRYYVMFALIGNFGLVLAGQTLLGFARYGDYLVERSSDSDASPFGITLHYITVIFVVMSLIFMYLYYWVNKNALGNTREEIKTKKKKPKLSLKESLNIILSSKYLFLIFILVVSYGTTINLVEVIWKKQVGRLFPSMNDYLLFMGKFSTCTGVTTILIILISTSIIRVFGWLAAAIATPIMLLLTSSVFFSTILFTESVTYITTYLMTTPLIVSVIIGTIQNTLTKATKYSLFDSSKEIVYIPLSDDIKIKGKAAVDVVGGRLGKSCGSIIQQILLITCASGVSNGQEIIAPYLFGFILLIIVVWIIAIYELNRELIRNNEDKKK